VARKGDLVQNAGYFAALFEIGRRYKIMNPGQGLAPGPWGIPWSSPWLLSGPYPLVSFALA